ncbi:hypothetical protein ABPG75_006761 [Micractinium tetrahymenae]
MFLARCKPRTLLIAIAVGLAGMLLRGRAHEVYTMSLLLLANTGGRAWGVLRASPAAISPLHAAMLNVTSDYSQLAHLVADFIHQPGQDPELEQRFTDFLAQRAAKSYPRLESALDWLLAIYKFIFPFLIISLVAKLQGPEAPCPEPPATGAGEGRAGLRGGSLADFKPASPALSLPGDRNGGTNGRGGSGAAPLDRRRQLAVSDALASRATRKHAGDGGRNIFAADAGMLGGDSNGGDADRAGNQSPRGPETPVEGGHLLSLHPAMRQVTGSHAARRPPVVTEIDAF